MTYKYEVGDKVTIRQKEDMVPSWDWDEESMGKYCGKEAAIKDRLPPNRRGIAFYEIDIDNGMYLWTEDMFIDKESVAQKSGSLLTDILDNIEYWVNKDQEVSETTKKILKAFHEDDDLYSPELDYGMLIWDLFSFVENSDIGKIEGQAEFEFNKDEFKFRANLEGNRELIVETRRK